jgi:heme/copper-type cytochrome/quinol oxidase subunit 3
MRIGAPVWGTPFGSSSIVNGVVMTAILLSSSLTMLAAVRA